MLLDASVSPTLPVITPPLPDIIVIIEKRALLVARNVLETLTILHFNCCRKCTRTNETQILPINEKTVYLKILL
jgi:hypothetical protein